MSCSVGDGLSHNARTCTYVFPQTRIQKKRTADAASLGAGLVQAQRPRVSVEVLVGEASSQAPAKLEKIFDYFETSPAGSPIEAVTKQVVPWVDHMLFEKMKRCLYFFHCQENS